jgi:glutamate-1-semialdehyde 2,1-aminomutase
MVSETAQQVVAEITERYLQRTPASRAFDSRAKSSFPGGDTRTGMYYRPYPTYMEKGLGCVLIDYDGNSYIDFHNNASSLIHGHCFPPIVDAVRDQMDRGTGSGCPSVVGIRLGEVLKSRVTSLDLVRFASSGSEATLFCVRAARAFTGKSILVKMDGGCHGGHDCVDANTSADLVSPNPPQLRFDNRGIPPSILGDLAVVDFNDLASAASVLRANKGKVAAIIVEPMMFGGGLIPPQPGYLRGLREEADRNECLLIFDEVVTFRLSEGGFQNIEGVQADLTAFGKMVTGGYPGAMYGGRRDIMLQYDPSAEDHLRQSGTFNGANVAMAAGVAALENLPPTSIDRINTLGGRLRKGLSEAFVDAGIRGRATGMGSLAQAQFTDKGLVNARDVALARRAVGGLSDLLHVEMLNRGVHLAPGGFFVISTPMTDRHIDRALESFSDALRRLRPLIEEQAPHILL